MQLKQIRNVISNVISALTGKAAGKPRAYIVLALDTTVLKAFKQAGPYKPAKNEICVAISPDSDLNEIIKSLSSIHDLEAIVAQLHYEHLGERHLTALAPVANPEAALTTILERYAMDAVYNKG